MAEIRRKGDLLSDDKKRKIIEEIISFFKEERDEEIGIVAAGNFLEFFLQNVGLNLYNKGVEDSMNFLKSRFDDLAIDMEVLLKR